MKQVLAPNYKFKTRSFDDEKPDPNTILIKGFKKPSTKEVQAIIDNDINDLKAKILQDDTIKKTVPGGLDPQFITTQLIPKIIRQTYPDLSDYEVEWQPDLVKLVRSVVGIGKRATAILIVSTQGFKHTATYQQLISYAGLSPKEYSSGSSIRGKVRICKQRGSAMRHTLYMCALNAKETNGACKELFDRLVAKGKNKKLAVIAVANKLLKQVFGVVKTQTLFDRNFYKKIA